jgi:hypothetical protein
MWDFLNETVGEKLHEGQNTFHAASASEPPGKRLSQIKSVPVRLTLHDRNDMDILTEKGTSGLRKHKILRMASEAPRSLISIFDISLVTGDHGQQLLAWVRG